MATSIKQQEQEHLENVIRKIKVAQNKSQKRIDQANHDESTIRNNFSNDLRISTDSYTGMMETALSVRQQQQLLSERKNSWQHATSQLSILQRLEKSPYFARIDFHETGEAKSETIYIGMATFSDRMDHFLVYDWRAPISNIYYDGGIGEVTYFTPDGDQTVNVKLKRQLQIEDGTIKTVFDTDEAVGDHMLLDALSEQSDTKMRSIVTTIQKEQNQIIRDTKSELLFVQGAAGSGKTVAILQRVAYLLYRYRGHLNAGQLILFSPNQLFNDYIDQVLPELGEQNMVQMTYYQYVGRRLPNFQIEMLSQRFNENYISSQHAIDKFKSSLMFFNSMTLYTNHLQKEDMFFRNINFRGKPFFTKEKIHDIYYSFNDNYNLKNRIDGTKEQLIKLLNQRVISETSMNWVEEAVQSLSKEKINQFFGNNQKEFDSADEEFQFLARKLVIQAFQPIQQIIVRNNFLSINYQFIHMLKAIPFIVDLQQVGISTDIWKANIDQTMIEIKDGNMMLSNVTPYMYLYDLISGKQGERDIRYVFIDEIQDYTSFQLAFLKFSFPRARFTLLGDLNQAIFTKENSKTLLSELSTMFNPEKTRVVQLTQSYRSTQQITNFTRHILINGESVTVFDRNGDLPQVIILKTVSEAVNQLESQIDINNVSQEITAIICKTLNDCRNLYDILLKRSVVVTLIQSENQRLVSGIIIVPSYLSKGLEFDAVIVWDASEDNYHDENERKLLYTICSRAMHLLTIIATYKLSPLFDTVPMDKYERLNY